MESEVGGIFLVRVNLFRICRSEWSHGGMGRKTPGVGMFWNCECERLDLVRKTGM